MRAPGWAASVVGAVFAAVIRGADGLEWEVVKERLAALTEDSRGAWFQVVDVEVERLGDEFAIQFVALGHKVDHVLTVDRGLVHAAFQHHVVGRDGARKLDAQGDPDCLFYLRASKSVAFASTCGGSLSGLFAVSDSMRLRVLGAERHAAALADGGRARVKSIVYRDDAPIDDEWSCGSHDTEEGGDSLVGGSGHGEDHGHLRPEHAGPHKLAASAAPAVSGERALQEALVVGSAIKYIKMLIVNDKERYAQLGDNTHADTLEILSIVQRDLMSRFNSKSVYKLQIEVVGMISFSHGDPWGSVAQSSSGESDQNDLLRKFSAWRANQIRAQGVPEHGVAHLLSGKSFNGTVVGLANLRTLCSNTAGTGVIQAKGFTKDTAARIVAHELMHNLGSYHTNQFRPGTLVPNACSSGFIMDPAGIRQDDWSECTVNWVRMSFNNRNTPDGCAGSDSCVVPTYGKAFPRCAETRAERVYTLSPSCGNGIKEADEECDCGADNCGALDPCCDGATCKLLESAVCSADDACCDKATCRPVARSANRVCRPHNLAGRTPECDVQEVCNGVDSSCPRDVFTPTGTACENGEGACYAGECQSHAAQCRSKGWQPCLANNFDDGDEGCAALRCSLSPDRPTCFDIMREDDPDASLSVEDGTPCNGAQNASSAERSVCHNAKCVNSTLVPLPIGLTCSNGVQDELETDVDCGGPACLPCMPREKCLVDSDCFGTDVQPGRCNAPTSAPTSAPTIREFLRPLGQTCKDLGSASACDEYSGCIWLEEFALCKDSGWFPDRKKDCSRSEFDSSCCDSQKSKSSCINWLMCVWDDGVEVCNVNPLELASGNASAAAPPTERVVGTCREYTSGGGDGDSGGSTLEHILTFWAIIEKNLPIILGGVGSAVLLGSAAAFCICMRHCSADGKARRKAAAARDRQRRASSSSSSVSSAATIPAPSRSSASLAPVGHPSSASMPLPMPVRAPVAAAPVSPLRPCPACMVHFSNASNVGGLCNACDRKRNGVLAPGAGPSGLPRMTSFASSPPSRSPPSRSTQGDDSGLPMGGVIPVARAVSPDERFAPSAPPAQVGLHVNTGHGRRTSTMAEGEQTNVNGLSHS